VSFISHQYSWQGWKKPNPHGFYCFIIFFVFIINSIFLAVYQCLNAFTVLAHAGVLKNIQG